MELDDEAVLANFRALDLRIGHVIEVCQSLEQLGRSLTNREIVKNRWIELNCDCKSPI